MRKTFLKVALIGLLVGSLPVGFTSCKDYDDDIEQTNNQVADLKTKLASVETAIAALPSKADVTAAQAAAVAQAKADLEAVKAELEAAIDNKADKADVEAINGELSKIQGQLETLDALKADVADALEAVAKVTELDAELQKQGQAIAGLTAQMETLTGSLATEAQALKDDIAANKTSIEAIEDKLAELAEKINGEGGDATPIEKTLGVLKGMITSLRIVDDWGAFSNNRGEKGDLLLYNSIKVDEVPTAPKSYLYENGEPLKFDLVAGQQKDFTDKILVQVSPAGAPLNADQLVLINSDLDYETIKNYVVISEVKPYKDLLSRAYTNNGLYEIVFSQNPGYKADEDAEQAEENETATNFLKATCVKDGEGKQIRFALAFNDKGTEEDRVVMTPYDITVTGGTVPPTYNLEYTVKVEDGKTTYVQDIHNRFFYAEDGSSYMYVEDEVDDPASNMPGVYAAAEPYANFAAGTPQGYVPTGDYCWKWDDNGSMYAAYDGDYSQGEKIDATNSDNRTALAPLAAEMGKKITIKVANAENIYGYYVGLDLLRATESDESERAAWVKYADNITGLNKLFKEGEDIEFTIENAAEVPGGDVIGFRVWAVNYDGSLVDPDGKAFYVKVGNASPVKAGSLAANVKVTVKLNDAKNAFVTVMPEQTASVDKILGWTSKYSKVNVSFAMNNDEKKPAADASTVALTFNNGGKAVTLTSNMKGEVVSSDKSIDVEAKNYTNFFKNIKVNLSDAKFYDGQVYTGTITVTAKDGEGRSVTVQEITVTVKKVMPTSLPESFAVSAGLVKDGVLNIFANGSANSDKNLAITASLNDVFRMYGASLNSSSLVWGHMAFMLQLTEATQDKWGIKGDKPMFTNWMYQAHDLTFTGYPNQTAPATVGSQAYLMTEFDEGQVRRNLNGDIATAINGKLIPTLDIVNGPAQNLSIWFQYDGISYVGEETLQPYVVAYNKPMQVRVQTYPNTYKVALPEMPTLEFDKFVYLNKSAVTLSSDWTTKVTNTPLPTVTGWFNATAPSIEKLMSINTYKTKSLISLTGDVAQYFDAKEVTPESGSVKVNPTTGEVTITATVNSTKVTAPVYGVPVVKNADGEYVRDTNAGYVTELVAFVPNKDMTNAPAVSVTGKFTLTYTDMFGFGQGLGNYENVYGIIPYMISDDITMKP